MRPLTNSTLVTALLCVALLVITGCSGDQGSAQNEGEETSSAGTTAEGNTGGGEAKTTAERTAERTGGSGTASLFALGAGALLVVGGLVARRIVK